MNFPVWYKEIIDSNSHCLIAGCTGSGKSVLLNGIICRLLCTQCGLILIDPKKVELYRYKNDTQTMEYCTEPYQIIDVLQRTINLMYKRLEVMQRDGVFTSRANPVYIVIDELADLMIDKDFKKKVTPLLIKLTTLGRATRIFVIGATQKITSVIDTWIRANFDFKICLRVTSKNESKGVLDAYGGEQLPRYGRALVRSPLQCELMNCEVRYYSDSDIKNFLK